MHFTRVLAAIGTTLLLESNSIADGVDVPASVISQVQSEIRNTARTSRPGDDYVRTRACISGRHDLGRNRKQLCCLDHSSNSIKP